jgi:hypothetical protein
MTTPSRGHGKTARATVNWIPSHVALANHPKVTRLAAVMAETENEMLGALHRLWWFAATYAQDGDLTPFTAVEIARACHVSGRKSAVFFQTLVDVGWIDEKGAINDWPEYGGRSVAESQSARERMARLRGRNRSGAPETAPDVREHDGDGSRTFAERSPNIRQTFGVRGEERRVDTTTVVRAAPPRRRTRLAGEADTGAGMGDGQALWAVLDTHLGPAKVRNERGRRAAAVRDLSEAGVTPDLLEVACANWPRVFPRLTMTDTAIASHYGKLTEGVQARTGVAGVKSGSIDVLSQWMQRGHQDDGDDTGGVFGGDGTVVGQLSSAGEF